MTSHLVIGLGEVGVALRNILKCDGLDVDGRGSLIEDQYDVIHICYPWQIPNFMGATTDYTVEFNPQHVVVHSTVPVGTCDIMDWTHSPVRGKHPDLEAGLRAFRKHYGGTNAYEVAVLMEEFFPSWMMHPKAATTEAGKLWELMQYGLQVTVTKEMKAFCDEFGLDFQQVYTDFADSYNEGWLELNQPQFMRPVLKYMDGPIGGHCVIPGTQMLYDQFSNALSLILLSINDVEADEAAK